MDWDAILENLPINTRPDTITALEFATERFFDRGDCDVLFGDRELCNGIDIGHGLVKVCVLVSHRWMDIPADVELRIRWD